MTPVPTPTTRTLVERCILSSSAYGIPPWY
jgi:hypothetical protein